MSFYMSHDIMGDLIRPSGHKAYICVATLAINLIFQRYNLTLAMEDVCLKDISRALAEVDDHLDVPDWVWCP